MPEVRYDLLRALPATDRQAFEAAARQRSYAAGQTVYAQGDRGDEMYHIRSGVVRLSFLKEDGRELIHTLFHAGDCFGVSSLIDGEPRPQTAEAQDPCEIGVITRKTFDTIRARSRAFDNALLLLLIGDVRKLITRVNDLSLDSLPSRLARRLLQLAHPNISGELEVRLPQAQLAQMIDVSRVTTNKILRTFEADGLVALQYGSIVILQQDLLRSMFTAE